VRNCDVDCQVEMGIKLTDDVSGSVRFGLRLSSDSSSVRSHSHTHTCFMIIGLTHCDAQVHLIR